MAKAKVKTKSVTYKGDRAYQRGVAKMLSDGWTIQSETMTEHRGAMKWLTLGIGALILPKRRHYHVLYVRDETPSASSQPSSPAQ